MIIILVYVTPHDGMQGSEFWISSVNCSKLYRWLAQHLSLEHKYFLLTDSVECQPALVFGAWAESPDYIFIPLHSTRVTLTTIKVSSSCVDCWSNVKQLCMRFKLPINLTYVSLYHHRLIMNNVRMQIDLKLNANCPSTEHPTPLVNNAQLNNLKSGLKCLD